MLANAAPREACWIAIPMTVSHPEILTRFCEVIKDEAEAILTHRWYYDLVAMLTKDLWPDKADAIMPWTLSQDGGEWSLVATPQSTISFQLVWRARSAWPVLLGAELRALSALLHAGYFGRESSVASVGHDTTFINLSDRAWPRPIQTRMIQQGQLAADPSSGPSLLAEDLVARRLAHEAQNISDFSAIGFSADEAKTLNDGGLVALRASDSAVPGGGAPRDIGTTPLNEINIAESAVVFVIEPDQVRPDSRWTGNTIHGSSRRRRLGLTRAGMGATIACFVIILPRCGSVCRSWVPCVRSTTRSQS